MANYLYNGVELPALPEWNKETHPYAIIGYSDIQGYVFSYSADAWTANEDGQIFPSRFLTYRLSDDGATWVSTNGVINHITPIWANFNILNDDGSVYLAASTPVPVGGSTPLDPTALLMGWMVGKRVAGLRKTQTDVPVVLDVPDTPTGDPVAYLYNGVRLPDINEVWTDKDAYPYAVMCQYVEISQDGLVGATCNLWLFENKPVIYSNYDDELYLPNGGNLAVSSIIFNCNDAMKEAAEAEGVIVNQWEALEQREKDTTPYWVGGPYFLWTNFDLLKNEDGTTYLAASEPIPVYE